MLVRELAQSDNNWLSICCAARRGKFSEHFRIQVTSEIVRHPSFAEHSTCQGNVYILGKVQMEVRKCGGQSRE